MHKFLAFLIYYVAFFVGGFLALLVGGVLIFGWGFEGINRFDDGTVKLMVGALWIAWWLAWRLMWRMARNPNLRRGGDLHD